MPSDKLFRVWFKPNKWKWYIVDLRDWHKPILVRKHLDNHKQARRFREVYFDKNYTVISGRKAIELNVKDYNSHRFRHPQILKASKYEYPSHIKTAYQRKVYRTQLGNRRRNTQKNRPVVTKTIAWEIIEDKPMKFLKRMTLYKRNHYPYSMPVAGVKQYKKKYPEIETIRHLANITRVLKKYYDLGDYHLEEVAPVIWEIWEKKIIKWCTGYETQPTDLKQIKAEFIARGFIPRDEADFEDDTDSFVETIHITPTLVYPERAWHKASEMGRFKHNVYELQKQKGIPGFTRASVAGLRQRR